MQFNTLITGGYKLESLVNDNANILEDVNFLTDINLYVNAGKVCFNKSDLVGAMINVASGPAALFVTLVSDVILICRPPIGFRFANPQGCANVSHVLLLRYSPSYLSQCSLFIMQIRKYILELQEKLVRPSYL